MMFINNKPVWTLYTCKEMLKMYKGSDYTPQSAVRSGLCRPQVIQENNKLTLDVKGV